MRGRYELSFAEADGHDPVRVAILPVPYDRTACYQAGSREGPHAIIRASTQMEFYDESLGFDPSTRGIRTLAPLPPRADGPHAMQAEVRMAVAEILETGAMPVVLGGDHSITIGVVEAMSAAYPDLSVLHLDAHADMRDSYEGSPLGHACVMRRVRERCPAVSVGIRSYSEEEAEALDANGIRVVSVRDLRARPELIEQVVSDLSPNVYLTLDVDVLDPSIMPATGTPEPGGLTWEEVDGILETLTSRRHLVGFDVVELMPIPGLVAPEYLAARLTYRTLGRALSGRPDAAPRGEPHGEGDGPPGVGVG